MIDQKELTAKLHHVILIKGFQTVSMSKLAAAVNVSRASLYLYFKSKDEIVQAVVARHLQFIAEHPVPRPFAPATFLPIWLDSLLLMGSTTETFTTELKRAYPALYQQLTGAHRVYFAQLEVYIDQAQQVEFIDPALPADYVLFQAEALVQTVLQRVQAHQLTLDRAETYLVATLHLQLWGLLTPAGWEQIDTTHLESFKATILREFRATYALIA
ncbi:TetR/AcrR family transcriptional regulator [Levilactobacillus enshiensis]|uniref:TetR/AcrR family transcriptional regulator n=1 Tax=Levilactobacillus enshiensis TaxID=2590213 RepID=UPI00117B3056|nr:TetR/AcrR family transcriptional regulator [Levilactobacillus enshiensis]